MSRCTLCTRGCRPTDVYVIGEIASAPTVKVGYAARASKRVYQLRRETGRDLAVLAVERCECEFKAMDVETEAHRLLTPHWSGRGEWFSCDAETAAIAVRSAIARLGRKGPRL